MRVALDWPRVLSLMSASTLTASSASSAAAGVLSMFPSRSAPDEQVSPIEQAPPVPYQDDFFARGAYTAIADTDGKVVAMGLRSLIVHGRCEDKSIVLERFRLSCSTARQSAVCSAALDWIQDVGAKCEPPIGLDELERYWGTMPDDERVALMDHLRSFGPHASRVIPDLIRLLGLAGERRYYTLSIARAVAAIGVSTPADASALRAVLLDSARKADPMVDGIEQAALALRSPADRTALAADLRRLLDEREHAATRSRAAIILAKVGDRADMALLARMMRREPDPSVRDSLFAALETAPFNPEIAALILDMSIDERRDQRDREQAAEYLFNQLEHVDEEYLRRSLPSCSTPRMPTGMMVLARRALAQVMVDRVTAGAPVELAGLRALARLSRCNPSSSAVLLDAARSPDPFLVCGALDAIGEKPAPGGADVQALLAGLRHESTHVRPAAAAALLRLARAARLPASALEEAAGSIRSDEDMDAATLVWELRDSSPSAVKRLAQAPLAAPSTDADDVNLLALSARILVGGCQNSVMIKADGVVEAKIDEREPSVHAQSSVLALLEAIDSRRCWQLDDSDVKGSLAKLRQRLLIAADRDDFADDPIGVLENYPMTSRGLGPITPAESVLVLQHGQREPKRRPSLRLWTTLLSGADRDVVRVADALFGRTLSGTPAERLETLVRVRGLVKDATVPPDVQREMLEALAVRQEMTIHEGPWTRHDLAQLEEIHRRVASDRSAGAERAAAAAATVLENFRAQSIQRFLIVSIVALALLLVSVLAVRARRALLLLAGRRWHVDRGEADVDVSVLLRGSDVHLHLRGREAGSVEQLLIASASWPPLLLDGKRLRIERMGWTSVRVSADARVFHFPWGTCFLPRWSQGASAVIVGQVLQSAAPPVESRGAKRLTLVAIGAPAGANGLPFLHGVDLELDAVCRAFVRWGGAADRVNGGTLKQLRDALLGAEIVHVASHATLSGLSMTDGEFDADQFAEVARQPLRCRLLVLSACDAGRLAPGEATLVARVLQEGVNVLASTAPLDNVVARVFFEELYIAFLPRRAAQGITLAEAIRVAVRRCGERLRESSYAWSDDIDRLVLFGDPTLRLRLRVPGAAQPTVTAR